MYVSSTSNIVYNFFFLLSYPPQPYQYPYPQPQAPAPPPPPPSPPAPAPYGAYPAAPAPAPKEPTPSPFYYYPSVTEGGYGGYYKPRYSFGHGREKHPKKVKKY